MLQKTNKEMNKKNKTVISANIEGQDLTDLEIITRYTGMNRQIHVRRAIGEYIAKEIHKVPASIRKALSEARATEQSK